MGSPLADIASVVKMKGLPFKASPEDILKFFQGFSLRPESVFLKRHPDGRPNGEVNAVWTAWQPLMP